MSDSATEAYEDREDAGKDDAGLARLWLDSVALARKNEADWRKGAGEARERYRGDSKNNQGKKFNILFANTQITLPAIYNSTPIPDVRRRFGDADATGKVAAQVLERSLSYSFDAYDFGGNMRAAVFDSVLAGRGVLRVRYEPSFEETEEEQQEAAEEYAEDGEAMQPAAPRLVFQKVCVEHVDWHDFIIGPGRKWEEVPWIGFEHRLTRDELKDRFGNIGATMPLDIVTDDARARNSDPRDVPDVFKRGTVYELWDKEEREVLFIAPSLPSKILKRVDDPLGLQDFWPMPRPIYDVVDSGSLVPIVPYSLYKDQAEELDHVTRRIDKLVEQCRYRGVYASDIEEFEKLARAQDGEFVPIQNAMQFAERGLDKAIWPVPLETLVSVIIQLMQHREALKATIYEITGLSDIVRGASVASETATAQQIKAQFGSIRIQDRQAEVQRMARDAVRLMAELIGEKFEPETLGLMTGVDLPQAQQKMMAQQAAMMAQQSGQPVPPEIEQVLTVPSWDDVLQVLRSDAMRGYRVDIETDSTVQADVARLKTNAAEFVQGFGGFIQAVGPAVQAGAMPMDVVADLLTAFARNFKLGRQAEDALERMGKIAAQPAPQQDQGAAAEAQRAAAEAQAEQQRAAMEMQAKQAEAQAKAQLEQEKLALEAQRLAMEAQIKEREIAIREAEVALKAQSEAARLQDSQAARVEARKDALLPDREALLEENEAQMRELAAAMAALNQTLAAQAEQQAQAAMMQAQALAQLAQAMMAPKRVVRGNDGRAIGVETTLN
ncbi:MAG: hypothetical protein LW713_01685 [Acetobacteraceae bacterium]|jgi:hypothetical protein|nr:hypothetical protein [Acetobacteraceae bacterium]